MGEVQSAMRSSAGHEYLTLRDEEATLDVVRFRGAIRPGEETPVIGEIVVVRGRVDLYSPRSRYQLVASSVERAGGMGLLSRELEALKRTLQAEGLFDASRKRPIPHAPRGIGLITSTSGAVLHDVLRVLRREAPLARLVIVHTAVQGAGAPEEIAKAIVSIDACAVKERRNGRSDAIGVLLLARGGGSSDDLGAFNAEVVLRAIAASATPIISAVGHESDVTLADLVADLRAGTPSIGAAALSSDVPQIGQEVVRLRERAGRSLSHVIDRAERRLQEAARALDDVGPFDRIERAGERVAQLGDDLSRAVVANLSEAANALGQLNLLLGALSPLRVLARGYAIVAGDGGRAVRSWRDAPIGSSLQIRLAQGAVQATVTDRTKEETNGEA
jgi:exodeoxyribonuclease VII large subunit